MKNKKGFTLPELLIVVTIIAVLVAIAIPVFSAQLHKSRVATDMANVRSYYSQLQYDFLENGYDTSKEHTTDNPEGLQEFVLDGQKIQLKEGSLWIAPEYIDNLRRDVVIGYNLLYECKNQHHDCELILPQD